MVQNVMVREKVTAIAAQTKLDKERWNHEREAIQSKFMKELDDDATVKAGKTVTNGGLVGGKTTGSGTASADEEIVDVTSSGTLTPGKSKKKRGKK